MYKTKKITVIWQYYSQNLFCQKQAFDPAGYVSKGPQGRGSKGDVPLLCCKLKRQKGI